MYSKDSNPQLDWLGLGIIFAQHALLTWDVPPSPVSPTHDVVFNDANLSDTFISGVPAIWKAQKTGPHRS